MDDLLLSSGAAARLAGIGRTSLLKASRRGAIPCEPRTGPDGQTWAYFRASDLAFYREARVERLRAELAAA